MESWRRWINHERSDFNKRGKTMKCQITYTELLEIIGESSRETAGLHIAISSMIPEEMLASISLDTLRAKISRIRLEHRASTPYDDDEYWLAQSPFDGKWYLFASLPCAGWPTSPVEVSGERPEFFDEE
jgi:hypothetical protein